MDGRIGRIQRQTKRCLIAAWPNSVSVRDLLEYSYPRISKPQIWHRVAVHRAVRRWGVVVAKDERARHYDPAWRQMAPHAGVSDPPASRVIACRPVGLSFGSTRLFLARSLDRSLVRDAARRVCLCHHVSLIAAAPCWDEPLAGYYGWCACLYRDRVLVAPLPLASTPLAGRRFTPRSALGERNRAFAASAYEILQPRHLAPSLIAFPSLAHRPGWRANCGRLWICLTTVVLNAKPHGSILLRCVRRGHEEAD
jgi:hypothetical protein